MTAPSAGDSRPAHQIWDRLAHLLPAVALVFGVIIIAVIATGGSRPAMVAFWVWQVPTWVVIFATRRHNWNLCTICFEQFPLDAKEQATGKRRRLLKLLHFAASRTGRLVMLAASGVALLGYFWWPLLLLVFAYLAVLCWAARWHRRLEPWCPYCDHWDNRGPREAVPDPEPDPAGTGQ